MKFVDNKAVENDTFVDEIRKRIDQLSSSAKWRRQYIDNKTHMMFHDQDIRIEVQEETRKKDFAIVKQINIWIRAGLSNDIIAKKLKEKYQLDDRFIHQLLD